MTVCLWVRVCVCHIPSIVVQVLPVEYVAFQGTGSLQSAGASRPNTSRSSALLAHDLLCLTSAWPQLYSPTQPPGLEGWTHGRTSGNGVIAVTHPHGREVMGW